MARGSLVSGRRNAGGLLLGRSAAVLGAREGLVVGEHLPIQLDQAEWFSTRVARRDPIRRHDRRKWRGLSRPQILSPLSIPCHRQQAFAASEERRRRALLPRRELGALTRLTSSPSYPAHAA